MNIPKIAIIGLGYVGLPVAIAFGRKTPGTIGFDLSKSRIDSLKSGHDKNKDVTDEELNLSDVFYTNDESDLVDCDFFVVAVPTPIDEMKKPNLGPLVSASEMLGRVIKKDSIIVFESTVYPGVTEDICGPIIESISGLKQGYDFHLGYSPERINPGDREHRLETITKVVSGDNPETLKIIENVYGLIIDAGVYSASSIKVAEAAKVIENTQRDLNIALMNELAIIFDKMNIPSKDVFEAANTKWNFLPFKPGLVGGHCIGVDPYYLTTKAEQLGYRPQVILSGRRINDGMGAFIANKTIKLMIANGKRIKGAMVGVLGITFKENVSDIRNSRVPDIIKELSDFGVDALVCDPIADPKDVQEEFQITLNELAGFVDMDAVILAVAHSEYIKMGYDSISSLLCKDGIMIDVKGVFADRNSLSPKSYWSL